jgi:ADP-ribose pyrophosphatase
LRFFREAAVATRNKQQARVLSTRVVYRGSIFDVRRDKVREPGGVLVTRDVVVHYGSVVLVPVLDDGRILLVRQYRHATGQFLWELVAGRTERGENPSRAARRELVEETGYTGRRFRRLIEFFPTPGFVSERMVLFLVEGLKAGTARPEEDEKIEVGAFSPAEIDRRIRRGTIRDGKTIAGLLYYLRYVTPKPSRSKRTPDPLRHGAQAFHQFHR